jgi:hypothetical protein
VIDQLDRSPEVARVLAQPGEERLLVEVVRHARGMREQQPRRSARQSVERTPALQQLAGELVAEAR